MDTSGRWWLVGGVEVDLSAEEGAHPMLHRAAALAYRDVEGPAGEDLAAFLEWAAGEEEVPEGAYRTAVEFLAGQAWELVARLNARMDRIEARRAA